MRLRVCSDKVKRIELASEKRRRPEHGNSSGRQTCPLLNQLQESLELVNRLSELSALTFEIRVVNRQRLNRLVLYDWCGNWC